MMGVSPVRLERNRLLGRGLCFFELVLLGKADRQKRVRCRLLRPFAQSAA